MVIADAFDSNPSVSGKGVERLRESGISVATGVLEQEARALNEAFHYFMRRQKPFVTLKTAMTLDGKIATHSGSSRWITGEAARREVHRLRHRHDAILVGIGTVIKDNPSLTTRLPVQGLHPIRIIMDSTLRIPLDAKVVTDGEAPTWIFTTDDMDQKKKTLLKERGVEIFSTGPGPRVEIHTMLNILAEKQVLSLLLEGGGEVNGAFLEARAVSKVVAFMAPKLIGGTAAPGPIGGEGVAHMEEAIALENVEVETVGKDVKVTGYPAYSGGD